MFIRRIRTYLGSSFVNLFTRFGHNYMVYAQADGPYRLQPDSLKTYHVRSQSGEMIPLGTVAGDQATQGAAVIPLYNLFPSATINGSANEYLQLRARRWQRWKRSRQNVAYRDEL